MRLLLDECIDSEELRSRLLSAGHDVESSRQVLGSGVSDQEIYKYAVSQKRIVVTENYRDFKREHDRHNGNHAGIFTSHREGNGHGMNGSDFVHAIGNIERAFPAGVQGQCIPLNHYQWGEVEKPKTPRLRKAQPESRK